MIRVNSSGRYNNHNVYKFNDNVSKYIKNLTKLKGEIDKKFLIALF